MGDDRITPHDADELARCFRAQAPRLFGRACVLARGDRALAEEQLRSWLWSTLANIAAGRFRREAAFRDRLPRIEARYRKTLVDPSEQAFSSIVLERCWRIIREMPPRQHTIAMLRWQLDMKEAEIAALLGVAEKTVSAQLHRARRKLIMQLGADHPFTRGDGEGASP